MEEIIIISNYYPPEKGAASNRIEQLALKLKENNYKVTVICPLGNYPKGMLFPEYKGKFIVTENREEILVKRLWIYPSISKNVLVRLLSVLSFSSCLFFYLVLKKTPQKIVIQSPPLLLSFISVLVLSLKKKKIILNVSDLWPLAAIELKALKKDSISHKISLIFERFIYKKSTFILGQSEEIIEHIQAIIPDKECYLYRNYPEHKLQNIDLKTSATASIKIFYAGLLGIAQGVLELCKKIEIEGLNIELHLFGDGAEKTQIIEFIASKKNISIFFYGMLDRDQLHEKLQSFDIAIVPLKTRIFGSVPSKIFEYTALGFPILYFGGGEGETIVLENKLGWVAEVGDYDALNKTLIEISAIDKLELEILKKHVFETSKSQFNLNEQIQSLLEKKVF